MLNYLKIYIFGVVVSLCSSFLLVRGHTHEEHDHKLSDTKHYKDGNGGHDTSYDHDAFLGKAHGHDFDNLKPEESKRRLKEMLKKVKYVYLLKFLIIAY